MKKLFWIFSLFFVVALPFVLSGCNEHKMGETVKVDDLEITVNSVNVQPTTLNLNKVVLVNVTVKNVGSSTQNIGNYLGPLRVTQKREEEDDQTESPAKPTTKEDLVCARSTNSHESG